MEHDFEEYEEYLREIQNYRKNIFDAIINKYTNNGSQDFLIDVKTLKIVSYKDAEPTMPSYSTLTTYYCEPARKLIKELSSYQKSPVKREIPVKLCQLSQIKSVKDTSQKEDKYTRQKEPLEWGKDSGIYSDTSSTTDSLQESFSSSDEESGKYPMPQTIQKPSLSIDIQQFSFRRQDSKVSEDLDSSLKIPLCDLSIGKSGNKMFEKDLDSSLKKSKRDLSIGKSGNKMFEKDLDSSLKKSKRDLSIGNSGNKMFEKDLDSSLKKSKQDLSFRRSVFEKDFDSSLKKSKWENRKPNNIPVRRNPAFKRDTSFLRNIQLDDLHSTSRSLSKSSNNINCSSKQSSSLLPALKRDFFLRNIQLDDLASTPRSLSKSSNNINFSSKQSSSIYYVKKGQTGQEQKTSPKNHRD